MRSDLNEFVTRYLSIVGAALMLVAFVGFVATAYDEERANGPVTAAQDSSLPASTSGS
jgi:hypothetical protein